MSLLSSIEETGEEFEDLKKLIVAHLQSMECEFQRYFPELEGQEAILIQNPFSASLDASGIPDEIQDQYFDLKNDSSARILYHEKSLSQFWRLGTTDLNKQTNQSQKFTDPLSMIQVTSKFLIHKLR